MINPLLKPAFQVFGFQRMFFSAFFGIFRHNIAMLFSELLKRADIDIIRRKGDAEVSALASDSRCIERGSCFIAVRGFDVDGHKFISDAISAGCCAIVCEDDSNIPDGLACAVVKQSRPTAGLLGQAFFDFPAKKLVNIGVTGTNGKTTVAHLIKAVLTKAGHCPGLLGTIAYDTGKRQLPAGATTPDPILLAQMAAEMVQAGKSHLVMEVSSHALDQHRTAGIDFNVGVFTNLTGDHLDYHQTMEQYLAAKRELFINLDSSAVAVLNRSDSAAKSIADSTAATVKWYSLADGTEISARIEKMDAGSTRFKLRIDGKEELICTPLIGKHNILNCLAAAAVCSAVGVELSVISAALEKVDCVPGRLQRVNVPAPYKVFVDYAHTDDALENVLRAVRDITAGRLIVVFGCGGDRDRSKRPRMAAKAEELADLIFVTSDNPRTEQPQAIIDEIVAGFSQEGSARSKIIPDRREAIESAVNSASDGDVVLIAGKGHEDYQILGSQRIHFDDVEVASEAIRGREGMK